MELRAFYARFCVFAVCVVKKTRKKLFVKSKGNKYLYDESKYSST